MTQGRAATGQFFPGSARRPIAHGTTGGYRAHFRHGAPMCEPCRDAHRKDVGAKPFQPAKCGTTGGYQRHLDRAEPTCADCRAANTEARRARRRAS
jgi:hypothetical protein